MQGIMGSVRKRQVAVWAVAAAALFAAAIAPGDTPSLSLGRDASGDDSCAATFLLVENSIMKGDSSMPEQRLSEMPPKDILGYLQAEMISALLLQDTLPGGVHRLQFPDLAFLLRQDMILVLDENLVTPISIENLPRPLRFVTANELAEQVRQSGDLPYLRFLVPTGDENSVTITLEIKIASADMNKGSLGLGAVSAQFAKTNGEWRSTQEARILAY